MPNESSLFLDHHSTTPVDERVLVAMLPYFSTDYGNAASSAHQWGREAERAVNQARAEIAALIGAQAAEIVFTSGATESNNLALKGVIQASQKKQPHLITLETEHKSVVDTAKYLQSQGIDVTFLPVNHEGRLELQTLHKAITPQTVLISVMLANNEVGTLQDIAAIGKIAREANVVFHCDAAQGLGYVPLDVKTANVDLLSISGHKLYAPKGIGALYVSRRVLARDQIQSQIHGGGHEQGLRSGTLNVPGIVGLASACALMSSEGSQEAARLEALRNRLQDVITSECSEVFINGPRQARHPGNLNISVGGVDGASLLLELNQHLAVSSGAACSSAKSEGSYVLRAMGVSEALAKASIRFGLGRHTTEKHVTFAAKVTCDAIRSLRKSG